MWRRFLQFSENDRCQKISTAPPSFVSLLVFQKLAEVWAHGVFRSQPGAANVGCFKAVSSMQDCDCRKVSMGLRIWKVLDSAGFCQFALKPAGKIFLLLFVPRFYANLQRCHWHQFTPKSCTAPGYYRAFAVSPPPQGNREQGEYKESAYRYSFIFTPHFTAHRCNAFVIMCIQTNLLYGFILHWSPTQSLLFLYTHFLM